MSENNYKFFSTQSSHVVKKLKYIRFSYKAINLQ